MIKWAVIFVIMALVDYVYARYTYHIAEGNAPQSAIFSMAIIVLGGFGIITYTTDPWLLIPAALGAGWGTYWTVRISK